MGAFVRTCGCSLERMVLELSQRCFKNVSVGIWERSYVGAFLKHHLDHFSAKTTNEMPLPSKNASFSSPFSNETIAQKCFNKAIFFSKIKSVPTNKLSSSGKQTLA